MASSSVAGRNRQAAIPAGSHVIRMPFQPRSLVDDLRRIPIEVPKAEASATPASRTAAEEPQPMPTGMPLRMLISSGTSFRCSAASTDSYV